MMYLLHFDGGNSGQVNIHITLNQILNGHIVQTLSKSNAL